MNLRMGVAMTSIPRYYGVTTSIPSVYVPTRSRLHAAVQFMLTTVLEWLSDDVMILISIH